MKKLALFALTTALSVPLFAAIKTEVVTYKDGKTTCEGYLAYDDSVMGKRPGVLVVHDWMGLGDYTKNRTRQLAELGYVAFAADIYGKGVRASNMDQAKKYSTMYKSDRKLFRSRVNAALDTLRKNPRVDTTRLAGIGYCFGGTAVLELARSGADVDGVVSFHGGLDTPTPEDAKNIKGKVLVLHGADDPYVKREAVLALEDEMKNANVDYEVDLYSHAQHGFTDPSHGSDLSTGMAYNEEADQRSWEKMKTFFVEIFK